MFMTFGECRDIANVAVHLYAEHFPECINCINLYQPCVTVKIYKTIILPVALYGCETWSLTLMEEHRLRVYENRVLRRIFGPKRDEVTGERRKLHNEELHNLYSSPYIIR
jgi:hypothetical protein